MINKPVRTGTAYVNGILLWGVMEGRVFVTDAGRYNNYALFVRHDWMSPKEILEVRGG